MVEKTIGKKKGKIHFEFDVELPEMKETAHDLFEMIKGAMEEIVDTGKKVVSKHDKSQDKEIKEIKIK